MGSPYFKRKAKIIRQYAIGWPIGMIFLVLIRSLGTVEVGSFDPGLGTSLIVAIGLGIFFGVISGFFQFLIEEKYYRQASIKTIVTFKLIYLLLFLVAMIVVGYGATYLFLNHRIALIDFAFDSGSGIIYAYIIIFDVFMLMIRQVNLMLGEGNLARILTGQFYEPHEEERIFMFIDLQSSTELAEQLGHIKYSRLIQDCFNDLSVTSKYYAQIYQYVGDEAVLTWEIDRGIQNDNCLNAFFAFKKQLESRKEHYLKEYNHLPFFKAGLNCGIVTVTEVGKYKREIAYHGDTINTAARVQSMCNEYGVELLISEYLYASLSKDKFTYEDKGCVGLKGKTQKVELYSVELKS